MRGRPAVRSEPPRNADYLVLERVEGCVGFYKTYVWCAGDALRIEGSEGDSVREAVGPLPWTLGPDTVSPADGRFFLWALKYWASQSGWSVQGPYPGDHEIPIRGSVDPGQLHYELWEVGPPTGPGAWSPNDDVYLRLSGRLGLDARGRLVWDGDRKDQVGDQIGGQECRWCRQAARKSPWGKKRLISRIERQGDGPGRTTHFWRVPGTIKVGQAVFERLEE